MSQRPTQPAGHPAGETAEDRFRVLADSVSDAIISADAASRIVFWSRGAEAMFGWSPEAIVGRKLMDLMPERFRDAHVRGITRLQETGERRLIGQGPIELAALHRDGHEFPIELTLGLTETGSGAMVTGVVRDITDRRDAERYRAAQYQVARALAEGTGVDEAGAAALEALGGNMDWDVGALWLIDEGGESLFTAAFWRRHPDLLPDFERLSRRHRFKWGIGLPGRVWATGRPVWLEDALVERNLPRSRLLAEAGLHAAVGLPLLADGLVVGVMEFFSSEIRDTDERLVGLMAAVSEQVGQFVSRKQAEDRLAQASVDLARRRLAERQAKEINENVIDHLVRASQALDADDYRAARREITATLEHASRIITGLGDPLDADEPPGREPN